jgi:trans-aconitate methyltransferase
MNTERINAERSEELRQQLRYARYIAPFTTPSARQLIRSLTLLPNMKVLDHGAGTGLVTQLALTTQPDLLITALDPSIGLMGAIPNDDRIIKFHGTTAEYCTKHQADAPPSTAGPISPTNQVAPHLHRQADATLNTPNRFDAILSNYALQFCGDSADELSRLRCLAKPGAPLRVAVLGTADVVEPFNRFWSAVAAKIPGGWPAEHYVHFQLGDPAVLAESATRAGWRDVVVKAEWAERTISAQSAWRWLSSTLPTGVDDSYRPLTKTERSAVREELIANWPRSGTVRTQYLRLEATAP